MAMGRPGDYLIENGEVAFVIQQIGRGFGFAEGGGNIVDVLVRIPAHLLAETTYMVNVSVYTRWEKESKIVLDNALTFMGYAPQHGEQFKSSVRAGVIAPHLEWRVEPVSAPEPELEVPNV